MSGYLSALNGTESTLRLKVGGVAFITSVGTFQGVRNNDFFELEFITTNRASGINGTFIGQGRSIVSGGVGFSTATVRPLVIQNEILHDTTTAQAVDATYEFTTASVDNKITITNVIFEILN
jgi:hypothetical protein